MIATSVESRVDTVFLRASELRGDERDSYLTDLCGIDRALRARVDQLLRESDRLSGDSNVLRTTMLRQKAGLTLLATKSETLPIALERYDLEARLGEGAFGVVYRAVQHTPVRRAVAIKVVRPGLDGPQIVRRFEAERQALATLDHANVARLFDAGNMPDGRPYFVMELLEGLPFTAHCEQSHLNLRCRLELFLDACAAVAHAHSRAILHRDLKPSNILVIEANGRAIVKVIDFGIARAIAAQSSSAEAFATEVGTPVGTPEYMCPEQAAGEHDRVDTRSDVYALGVVLYELICGRLPFTSASLRDVSAAEMRRIICEVDPPRPSAIGNSQELAELEWIPLRALKKDPGERYRSVAELADDVRNYLAGRPLMAGPDSRAYRARKWMARNRRALAVSGLIAVVAFGVAIQYARGIHAEQQRRIEALSDAQQQRDEAARQRRSADAVNRFLTEMLGAADPAVSRGDSLKVIDVLERAAADVSTRFAGQPDVQMSLHRVIGETYFSLGLPDRALMQFDSGIAIANRSNTQLADVDDALNAGRIRATLALGKPRDAMNAGLTVDARSRGFATESATAEALLAAGKFNEALVRFSSLCARVPSNLAPAARVALELNYARSVLAAGRQYDALPLLEQTATAAHEQLTAEHPQTIESDAEFASLLATVGEFKRAEPLLRDTLNRAQKVLGPDHPTTISVTAALASLLQMTGRFDESTSLVQQCIDHHSSRFGPDHPDALAYESMRAGLLQTLAKYDDAKVLLQDVIERRRRVLGEDHPNTIDSESAMGWFLWQTGQRGESETQMRRVLPMARRVFGDDHPATLGAINNLALSLEPETNLAEAESLYKEVIERAPHLMKWDAPQISGIYNNYGNLLKGRGRPEETLALQEKSLEARSRLFGEDSLDAAQSHNNVALALMDMSKFAEAEPHVKRSWELNRKWLGADHPSTLNSLNTYALVVDELHRIGEAEQFHRQILDARRRTMGLDHNLTVQSEINLASVLFRQKRPSESVPLFRHAYDVYEKEFGDDSPHTKMVAYRLAVCLERSGNTSEGEVIRRKHHIEPDPPTTKPS